MRDGNRAATQEDLRFVEARALQYEELLPATRDALRELLGQLCGAVERSGSRAEHEMLSTSFLVSGDRGFGKTTVILTAAAAIENGERYAQLDPHGGTLDTLRRQIEWLQTLDLEPVPKGANLLAALLVRIREALEKATRSEVLEEADRPGGGRDAKEPMLGVHVEKTWDELDRLVQDATFMWEESSHVNDPRRERAQQQIKAAEIFARFQREFTKTVDRVAHTLSRITSRHQPVLVLPVDNVDRSTEHIYDIVKLCRLASSPRLWFVLAAGRPDFQFFLERSFQQEMAARADLEDRDEDLASARRQASTTMRRALPRSHQIQIAPIALNTAWTSRDDGFGPSSLADLLQTLALPIPPGASVPVDHRLIQLFDVRKRVTDEVADAYVRANLESRSDQCKQREPEKALLTHAARMALLNLSPRALRDLRRSIDTPRAPDGAGCDDAVAVVVDQLRSAVDESILPFWAGAQLKTRILRDDMHGDQVLDLRGNPIQQLKQTHLSQVVPFDHDWPAPVPRPAAVVFSDVHLRKFDDIVLELCDLGDPTRRVPLPADVAGWFMLLHDLLRVFPTPRVISGGVTSRDPVLSPELIVTRHELQRGDEQVWLEFGWTLPEWDTFLDFSIFTIQWRAFLQRLEEVSREAPNAIPELLRYVRAAWVENVCSVCGPEHGTWDWTALKQCGSAVGDYEALVGGKAAELTTRCAEAERGVRPKGAQPYEVRRLARSADWFRRSLPMLLCGEHSVALEQRFLAPPKLEAPGVTLQRAQLVREAAARSPAYRARAEAGVRDPGGRWLQSVSDAWFGTSERRDGDRRRDGAAARVERRTHERRGYTPPPPAPSPSPH